MSNKALGSQGRRAIVRSLATTRCSGMPQYEEFDPHLPYGASRAPERERIGRTALALSAEAGPEPEILQWLIAKLPWGHTPRVLAWVKGQHLDPGRRQRVLVGRANRGSNS